MLPEFYEISDYETQQNFLKQEAQDEETMKYLAWEAQMEEEAYGRASCGEW